MASLEERYQESIRGIALFRLRVTILSGAFLVVLFTMLDRVIYPQQSTTFLIIRILVSMFLLALFFLSHIDALKRYVFGMIAAVAFAAALGIIVMIYMTEGIASSYREGLTLVLLALLFMNNFRFLINFIVCLAIVLAYVVACAFHPGKWPTADILMGVFMSGSALFFMLLMTFLNARQNREQFVLAEKLRENEHWLKEAYLRAKREAEFDEVVQVYNRRAFLRVLEKKLEYCRARREVFYLVSFSIDHYERINEVYGPGIGEEITKRVIHVSKDNLRAEETIGRSIGEAFLFIADEPSDDRTLMCVERIRNEILDLVFHDKGGDSVPISATFGAARFDFEKVADVESLIRMAGEAAGHARKAQPGSVQIYTPESTESPPSS